MKDNNVKRNTEKNASTPKSPNMNGMDTVKTKPHKQSGGKKVAEQDMQDQMAAQRNRNPVDPFTQMMQAASRNSRYSLPFENMGSATDMDPTDITPDENLNMPKKKRSA